MLLSSIKLRTLGNVLLTRQMANISNIAIIGAGQMGSGIAQVSAASGFNVTLVDVDKDSLTNAMSTIGKSLSRIAKKQRSNTSKESQSALVSSTMERIKTTTDLPTSVANCDLIIEAAVEKLDLKRSLFAQIEHSANDDAILATNTSSLCLEDISKDVIKDKSRFGGLHFFNPVPIMKLLEVVRTTETSDETFASMIKFGQAIGKTTVACKDSPGFIVNRLLVPYMFEALSLYERDDASMTDIDVAMKLGAGYPMGPFELADYVGLDTLKFIMDGWVEKYPNEPCFKQSELLNKLVAEGNLGRKTGEGFYSYKK
ncbi:unnamed protein product [Caenorhabditis bovis]|uniref:3-hydroxyacyl-CoA dehydrogenase n=1 Tax=Caenorhabditis bovis TaxID=2654633 RepID=A0A8S1EJZ7_9PELO|nr:unnamed protein product [Caenorhabditis bovis]